MISRPFAENGSEQVQSARRAARRRSRQALDFDVLNGHLGYFVRALQVRVFKDFIATLATMKVRPAQYSTLVLIAANPGRSQALIGEALNIERARFVRLLHSLEKRGWTERVPAPNDRRSHSLFITDEGRKALIEIKALAAKHEQHMSAFVGARRRQALMTVLKPLIQRGGP